MIVFPIHTSGFLSKVKEIKLLRGGVASSAAQATAPMDAEIGQKDHLGMETSYILIGRMLVMCQAALSTGWPVIEVH